MGKSSAMNLPLEAIRELEVGVWEGRRFKVRPFNPWLFSRLEKSDRVNCIVERPPARGVGSLPPNFLSLTVIRKSTAFTSRLKC